MLTRPDYHATLRPGYAVLASALMLATVTGGLLGLAEVIVRDLKAENTPLRHVDVAGPELQLTSGLTMSSGMTVSHKLEIVGQCAKITFDADAGLGNPGQQVRWEYTHAAGCE